MIYTVENQTLVLGSLADKKIIEPDTKLKNE